MQLQEQQRFIHELEKEGEAKVRADFERGKWISGGPYKELVALWLTGCEHDRVLREEQFTARAVDAAERAASASERSAAASEKSARFAMWSAIIALVTVGVGVLAGFIAWLNR